MLAASLLCFQRAAQAQTGITAISTILTTETGSTLETGTVSSGTLSATFAASNNDLEIHTFTDSANNIYVYTPFSPADATASIVRRNTAASGSGTDLNANSNGFSVWYANAGTSTPSSLLAAYNTSANSVLLGNNLLAGSDNLFVNNNSQATTPNQANVERVDFLFGTLTTSGGQTISSGIAANASIALAVFDRGVVNAHDPFHIALIMGYDSNGNPIYTNSAISGLKVAQATSASYGIVNPINTFSYTLFRDDNNEGNNLSTYDANSETNSQGVGGVVFSLSDFGITTAEINAGLTIYGYSVMAVDDTTTLANLGGSNYQNSADYPTSTTDVAGNDQGGIDLVAVNGIGFAKNPVPEPATYGVWFIGGGLALTCWRGWRRRRRLTSSAA